MNPLEARLRYKFRNPLLLAEALTHPSLGHETQRHHFDNQRLEFLGDAVLQLVYTEHLFEKFPDSPEGMLTKARARLVSREGLRTLSEELDLGRFMMIGRGEEASGGRARPNLLSDAFEAVIGAIYLDSDYITARRVVLHLSRTRLDLIRPGEDDVNPKGALQETLQSISQISPKYVITSQSGPEHDKRFMAEVTWRDVWLGNGDGRSKKEAEIAAARDALERQAWKDLPAKTGDGVSSNTAKAEPEQVVNKPSTSASAAD